VRPRDFVVKYRIKYVFPCFSGGKDSLVATHYFIEDTRGLDLEIKVLHVDTTIMLPGVEEYVRKIARSLGWNLVVLKPSLTFEEYVEKWGFPKPRARWCCYWLKLKPIKEYVSRFNGAKCQVTGLRRFESHRRKYFRYVVFDKKSLSWIYNPIVEWTDDQVEKYIEEHGLPEPPWYRVGIKETCCCGVFKSLRELRILRAQYPEFYSRFVELESKMKSKGSAFFVANRRIYAKDILRQKTLEEVI